jgi:ATP-dependent exoDNAse (exonuclease V) beta subunit
MNGAASAFQHTAVRRTIVLDSEQEAAISYSGNLLVRAGAGSGKTEVLARRFVALVAGDIADRAPLNPAALAAITFTERAALDLRKRIGVVLAERIAAENDARETTAERRQHLIRAQRTLALARISTIHAFCARILRENPLAAGLDPDFEVLDEYESDTFFERICRRTLVDAVRAGDPGARFLVRARRLEGSGKREGAIEIVQRLFTEARRAGHKADWILAETARAQGCVQNADAVADYTKKLVRLIDQLLEFPGVNRSALEELARLWVTARPEVLKLDESATPEQIETLREVRATLPNALGKIGPQVKEIRGLVNTADTKFGLGGSLVATWGERRAMAHAIDVARLIAQVGADFEAAQREERALTFDDLLIGARDLLRDHPDIAARYRDELRAILVDEYQDTNGVQDEIVSLLTAPEPDREGPELFIVGDEKQSIYRFRGADVRLFNLPRISDPHHLSLSGNRRSTPNILNFVNGLGAVAMSIEDASCPPYRVRWHDGHVLAACRATQFDYPVEIIAAVDDMPGRTGIESTEEAAKARPAIKSRAGEKRQLEARAIANRIRLLIADGAPIIDPKSGAPRPVGYRDIVVLFRAFSDIAFYEDALSGAGIPCYTVQGRGFYGRREVIDLVALLAAVDDPRDSLRLAAALRSPLFGLSDDCLMALGLRLHDRNATPRFNSLGEMFASETPNFIADLAGLGNERISVERAWQVLHELRGLRGQLALPAMVERALDLTDYESVMAGLEQGHQRIANLRKVVELAHRFDTHQFFTFHDFVAYLRRLTETEPYEPQAQILGEMDNVVRLMTIHQAKGLEFPVVILADAGRGPKVDSSTPVLDREQGVLIQETVGSGADEIPNAALKAYRDRLKDEEDAESVRILYVAVTRARDRLIVSEGAGKGGWVKHLRSFIGDEAWARLANTRDTPLELACQGARVVLRQADGTLHISEPTAVSDAGSCEGLADLAHRRLSFTAAASGNLMISPTALADFERCPRQYWLRHRLKLPERSFGLGGGEVNAAALGSVAHEVLERVQFGVGSEHLVTEIADLAERLGVAAGLTSEQRTDLVRDLARYVEVPRASESVVGREVPFMLNAAPSLFVRGQIDLIARAGDSLIVRDYKYSTVADARRYQIQLECYALAAAKAFPDCAIVAQIVALRDNPEPIDVPIPPMEAIRVHLGTLSQRFAVARRKEDYPKHPPTAAACHALGCGYTERCWGH